MSTYTLKKATTLDSYICNTLHSLEAAIRNNASSGLDKIDVAPNQGKMLYLLAKMIKDKRILEVSLLYLKYIHRFNDAFDY